MQDCFKYFEIYTDFENKSTDFENKTTEIDI